MIRNRLKAEELEARRMLTVITGHIAEDATWDLQGSPYEISGSAFIDEGVTVHVEAGVEVIRASNTSPHFFVNGALNLDGAAVSGQMRITVNGTLNATGTRFSSTIGVVAPNEAGPDDLVYANGSSGTIANSSFPQTHVKVFSPDVQFTGNQFQTINPITTQPGFIPKFYGSNTYTVTDTLMYATGSSGGYSATWKEFGNITRYAFNGAGVTIDEGDTVNVSSGVELVGANSTHLFVEGTLTLEGVETLTDFRITIEPTGQLNASDSTFSNHILQSGPGSSDIYFEPGSSGLIQNSQFPVTHLVVASHDVSFVNNDFQTIDPVTTNAAIVPSFYGSNSYIPDTQLYVFGHTNGHSATWTTHGNLEKYVLSDAIVVTAGDQLNVQTGVEISHAHIGQFSVNGTATLNGALVTSSVFFIAHNGGTLTVRDSSFETVAGRATIQVDNGATMSMTNSLMDGANGNNVLLRIRSDSTTNIHCNRLLNGTVEAVGPSDLAIDLTGNDWGTTNPTEIQNLIIDQGDFSFNPVVLVEPLLIDFPCVETMIHNDLLPADVSGDGVVSPLDALLVINELTNREFSDSVTGVFLGPASSVALFPDTDNNGVISPLDALLAINALSNNQQAIARPIAIAELFDTDEQDGEFNGQLSSSFDLS